MYSYLIFREEGSEGMQREHPAPYRPPRELEPVPHAATCRRGRAASQSRCHVRRTSVRRAAGALAPPLGLGPPRPDPALNPARAPLAPARLRSRGDVARLREFLARTPWASRIDHTFLMTYMKTVPPCTLLITRWTTCTDHDHTYYCASRMPNLLARGTRPTQSRHTAYCTCAVRPHV